MIVSGRRASWIQHCFLLYISCLLLNLVVGFLPTNAWGPRKHDRASFFGMRSHDDSSNPNVSSIFRNQTFPLLAIVTEPNACQSLQRMDETLTALSSALSTNKVNLICIRVDDAQSHTKELTQLTQRVMRLVERHHDQNPTAVVVNGNVEAAMEGGAHGVHVKEHRVALDIDNIRLQWPNAVIGTSVHDLQTGVETCTQYNPDYVFCGTCFPTQTHPGKTDLEGPALPGQLASALLQQQQQQQSTPTRVLAIGGISTENCHIPVQGGAHGVAIIRSILQAPDPALTTQMILSKLETVASIQYP
eukprot:CAMPEP_0198297554 /NCGR_PEP_ID=MMETSP1449-20131203/37192_1 /TAXON_ID=420275 /ORGANISM="Attheya septentrionalis, Strain CCMP2084" /LENGTH=302 /DNA_ID=CAMNT_0043998513 /DNA_START=84 /DNA_END=992 /DNA_ORIENTATION=-